jgi:hypothetical protein
MEVLPQVRKRDLIGREDWSDGSPDGFQNWAKKHLTFAAQMLILGGRYPARRAGKLF